MRNSVLLIDTNILLNYITNREDPYLEQSVEKEVPLSLRSPERLRL